MIPVFASAGTMLKGCGDVSGMYLYWRTVSTDAWRGQWRGILPESRFQE